MKKWLIAILLFSVLFFSGCTGPSDREISVIALTGLPILSILASATVLIFLTNYKAKESTEQSLDVKKHGIILILIITATTIVISITTTILLKTRGYGGLTLKEIIKIPFSLAGYMLGNGVIASVFLGPSTVLISILLFWCFDAAGKIKYHYLIPLAVSVFYFLLFVEGALRNSLPDLSGGIVTLIIISWPVQVAIIVAMIIYVCIKTKKKT